jgi:excisionase family DNA binding protein
MARCDRTLTTSEHASGPRVPCFIGCALRRSWPNRSRPPRTNCAARATRGTYDHDGRGQKPLDLGAEILTVREVSKYLRVSVSTVYHLAVQRELPAFKIAKEWRFSRASIDLYMREQAAITQQRKHQC